MSEIRPDEARRGGYRISGELVFDSVPGLLEQGRRIFASGDAGIELDFDGVTRADSAGLALLIEWMRAARLRRREIVFRNVPEQVLSIARVSGVDAILPLSK